MSAIAPCLSDAPASVFKFRKTRFPHYLSAYRAEIEQTVFSVMAEWQPQFRGAQWLYLGTDSAGFFMEPVITERVKLFNPRNLGAVRANAATAGMALSLVAFTRLACFTGDPVFYTAYNRLWLDAMDSPFAKDIKRLIA
ncbi:antirestriction protein [Marinobacter sp. SS13-12]|uniref:antirestriction protein n=1 Tax=Marinobacter sp. SS13-12 TaxID=3050451 RepID=UPI002555DCCC|nr:antirestriction protein [Marinobacter sp. SS13-12]MDK8465921.1 antirestriction protein [Marinobacter sp. SS13-12]